ncbi:lef-3 protein [Thysanoplusia orichalcea nucleopolyhedrovirus]|uniref:Lef-3 protein n=1 Tax=Thysanoplusia orichalcea nucleopolyhedrovirus TaxID=101850 RepID=L0CLJ7_9ABAC|nr:lef-3 protein [Thysanoplusia orichalcea nucleopolyhedrovirus]AGA16218.1 lef-3 protein [Thysanoplusia orichalcea nucleopolyhedrovirus]
MATKRSFSGEGSSDEPLIKRTAASPKKIKENYKQISGKLMSKMRLSIDNEYYYTFRIMSDNKIQEYYGDSQSFKDMEEGKCYEVNLNFVKTKFSQWIQINEYTECDMKLETSTPLIECLTNKHFENEASVNTLAKYKLIYKKINSNLYKIVFDIIFKNLNDDCNVVQIECSANAKTLINLFKSNIKNSDDVNEVFTYLKNNENEIFNIYNVKCQQIYNGSNVYMNWNLTNSTRIELCDAKGSESFFNLQNCTDTRLNISRSNKYVASYIVDVIKSELEENETGNNKFVVQFKSDNLNDADCNDIDSKKWNKSVFFVNTTKNTEADSLQKLCADFNQITMLLEDNLIKVIIYVTVDNGENANMNLLGLLKYDQDENEYKFL